MPDPSKYKDHRKYMDDCMHQMVKEEGVPQPQAVAVCLSKWRKEHGSKDVGPAPKKKKVKKCASDILRKIAYGIHPHE